MIHQIVDLIEKDHLLIEYTAFSYKLMRILLIYATLFFIFILR